MLKGVTRDQNKVKIKLNWIKYDGFVALHCQATALITKPRMVGNTSKPK